MRERKDKRDQLKEKNKRLTKRVKELEGIAFGYSHKLIIANQKIGELFKERDELYDKYVHKACDGYRC